MSDQARTLSSEPASAGVREFLVPDLGEGLEEATVVEWLAEIGDTVDLNQNLCVLETAKASVEIPSPFAGRLLERRGKAGDTLEVGSLLVRIQVGSGATEAGRPAAPPTTPADGDTTFDTGTRAAGRRTPTLVGYGVDEDQDRGTRRRRRTGRPVGQRSAVPGGPAPITKAPQTTQTPQTSPAGSNGTRLSAGQPLAKPPVRLLARRLGVDLAALAPGKGAGGIITRAEVLAMAETAAAAEPRPVSTVDGAAPRLPAGSGPRADELIPVRGIRARIAERMTLSRTRIPDATCTVAVDCTRLLEVRARLATAAEQAGAPKVITPFALIARLLVQTLVAHPELNSTFVEDGPAIRRHGSVHLGVGTATDRGLLVVVVRDAQRLTTLQLAEEIARLATAAREGRSTPAELTGSTFTVSNFGALGLDEGIPVVNYPEAAILGVGSVKPRAVVIDGQVTARRTASLTCAFDHRVADGAEAGAFMRTLSALIEEPDLALLRA
ncbi:dihydrolipoamide acetyltransferase family protein [Parafrankia elaeagni]|uniref:dihydrolipoamide acetyltransferase family protein n=1 Tax=Parafrankia elaeagni TaxID=222534 RepID=UPI000371FC50|nr:dihydrolipoamide acetyltransferase family protein [Parafrankia elaeagni]